MMLWGFYGVAAEYYSSRLGVPSKFQTVPPWVPQVFLEGEAVDVVDAVDADGAVRF